MQTTNEQKIARLVQQLETGWIECIQWEKGEDALKEINALIMNEPT